MADMYERMSSRVAERGAGHRWVWDRVLPVEIPGTKVGGVALLDEFGGEVLVLDVRGAAVLGAELQRQSKLMQRGVDVAQRLAEVQVRTAARRGVSNE